MLVGTHGIVALGPNIQYRSVHSVTFLNSMGSGINIPVPVVGSGCMVCGGGSDGEKGVREKR